MNHDLLLLSKNDIPFLRAGIVIHQPSIREIAYIGEENFFMGCELLRISKDIVGKVDKIDLEKIDDFDILMQTMLMPSLELKRAKEAVILVLNLLFPQYQVIFSLDTYSIQLTKDEEVKKIDKTVFAEFKAIITQMFCLKQSVGDDYNPSDALAKRIADQLKARHKKLAELQSGSSKGSIFGRYISILAVGLNKDINILMEYSVYQLFDEFERYQMKIAYDMYVQAKMAGAKDLEEVDNWMKEIHA